MARVGERLKQERESRNTSIADLSSASGIGETYLEALERGEIDILPGPAFGKLYIRAYAEVLGFDPQPWIDAYDRERRTTHGASASADPQPSGAQKERRVAAAIARWKESKASAPPVAEMEALEEQPEEGPVEIAPEPIPALEAEPEPEREPEPEPGPSPAPRIDPIPDPRPGPETDPDPEPRREPPRREPNVEPPIRAGRAFVLAGIVLTIAALIAWMFAGGKDAAAPKRQASPAVAATKAQAPPSAPAQASPSTEPAPPPVREGAPPPPAPAEPVPAPSRSASAPAPVETPRPGSISITESGIGRRIVASKLEGEGTEFTEGDSVVFQTRVMGGSRGETIRHVWIFDGRAQQSITLRLGSSDWRTHSKKTLYKRGPWTVEARDSRGTVLASASFTCKAVGAHR
jgi:transcriptional regulator with XRE-family HTH domain